MKIERFKKYLILLTIVLIWAAAARAQTTAFNYQGKLTDAGASQATYQMQFRLFDAASGGTQIGGTIENPSVAVSDGVFSVRLDFGANAFAGADRFLEIGVRRSAGDSYTILSPRQQIASSPYSIRTLSAQQADVALDSNKLGGVAASEYVTNATVGSSFIRNGATLQTGSFNISGNALVGGLTGLGTPANGNFRLDSLGSIRAFSSASAHFVAETTGGTNTWARFYMRSSNPNGTINQSWFMGTSQNFNGNQFYLADETAGQTRMAITTAGLVGFGTTNPLAGLELRGTGLQTQQRITDNTSGNSLVMQSGAGANMKITGFNYGNNTAVPLYLSVDGANTILNSGGGNVGIGTATPNAKLTVIGGMTQDLNSFGMPKAMIYVDPNANILRCYNGLTGAATGNCGFSVTRPTTGLYKIDFGFQVNNRLFSLAFKWQGNDRVGTITTSDDSQAGFPTPLTVNQIYVLAKTQETAEVLNSTSYVIVY
jgi:hypothetical protein